MRDDESGPILNQFSQSIHDLPLIFRIQRARRLIQNKNRGFLEQCAGQANSLHLPHAEAALAVAHLGFIALGQLHDEFMRMDSPGNFDHLLLGGILAPEEDILADVARQKQRLLMDDRDGTAEDI